MNFLLPGILILAVGTFALTKGMGLKAENFSVSIKNAKFHKVDWTGVDLRLGVLLTNLSNLEIKVSNVKIALYYMKPTGSSYTPQYLTTATVPSVLNIAPGSTTEVKEVKINVPYAKLIDHFNVIKSQKGLFRAVITGTNNNNQFRFQKEFSI